MKVGLTVTGVSERQTWLRRIWSMAPSRTRSKNRQMRSQLLAELVKRASSPPGPRVETGAYISNMFVDVSNGGLRLEAGNTSPQTARLEFGFVGVDALGRHYAQAPRPHFRPAIEAFAPRYAAEMGQEVKTWLQ